MSEHHQKTTLIIGGSGGLGTDLAVAAAQDGFHSVLIGKNKKALIKADDLVQKAGGKATLVPFDLRNINLIDQLALNLVDRFHHFDRIIFNAAYLTELRPICHTPNDAWDDIMAANLTSTMRLLRALDGIIRHHNKTQLMFITDSFKDRPTTFWGAYAVAKAGLDRLIEIYRSEISTCTGVQVMSFDPGPMATELRKKAYPGEETLNLQKTADVAQEIWGKLKSNYAHKAA